MESSKHTVFVVSIFSCDKYKDSGADIKIFKDLDSAHNHIEKIYEKHTPYAESILNEYIESKSIEYAHNYNCGDIEELLDDFIDTCENDKSKIIKKIIDNEVVNINLSTQILDFNKDDICSMII